MTEQEMNRLFETDYKWARRDNLSAHEIADLWEREGYIKADDMPSMILQIQIWLKKNEPKS